MQQALMTYAHTFHIRSSDCGPNGYMLPGALLRLCQQIATDHCDQLGMDAAFYQRTHTAFLLAKTALSWRRVPVEKETLTLITRPEMPKRAVFKRIIEVWDAQQNLIGVVDGRWILVDTDTHRILRHLPPEYQKLPYAEQVEHELPIRISKAEQTTSAGMAVASYTYCDGNGHMNNTRYADVACDALPLQLLKENLVQAMTIHYHRELPMGQTCQLERGQVEQGIWYVQGLREGKSCFEATLTLAAPR